MSNLSTAESWTRDDIGAQPRDLMPTSPDDIIEITDDMLIELSPEGEAPPPPPTGTFQQRR
jgi:hypothetical protein